MKIAVALIVGLLIGYGARVLQDDVTTDYNTRLAINEFNKYEDRLMIVVVHDENLGPIWSKSYCGNTITFKIKSYEQWFKLGVNLRTMK